MKIIYVANQRLPADRAYGIQIAKTCEAFAATAAANGINIEVELVAPYRISKVREDFFDFYSIKRNFKFKKIFSPDFYLPGELNKISFWAKNFISALVLSIYMLLKKSDVIYSRDELPLFILSFFKRNLVYEAHRFSGARKMFYRRFKKKDMKVITITRGLKEEFVKLGFNPEDVLVSPDGIDLDEFQINISQNEARNILKMPPKIKIIMYTGSLFEWKGAALLLEVARWYSECSDTFVDSDYVLFVFVGGMPKDIKEFRGKAEGLNNVLIVGHKPHKEIPIFLKSADVLVLPNSEKDPISRLYTSPLKLFEYMASGRPIIASDLPSIREVLNGENSVLVESDNPKALAGGIKKVLENENLASQIAQNALSNVQNYTWQKRAEEILKFIA